MPRGGTSSDGPAAEVADTEVAPLDPAGPAADRGEDGSGPGQAGQPGDLADLPSVDRSLYVIGEQLAEGGQGRILKARDRRAGRAVALKELRATNPAARARFEREARLTSRLQHPAIVPVYEIGRWPDGE